MSLDDQNETEREELVPLRLQLNSHALRRLLPPLLPIMICVAIVFTIAFIVIVGGIFGIFWGMHETEELRVEQ